MARPRTYSDDQLATAISSANSWRGTLRALGLTATSAAAIRSVRARAETLGLDHRHFSRPVVPSRSPARRSDLSAAPSDPSRALSINERAPAMSPELKHLNRGGALMAAAWFAMCGCDVSWPVEPARYDLLVDGRGAIRRVQVKTTTVRVRGTWKVYLSNSGRVRRIYEENEIDDFFVVTGDLQCYLIPVAAVQGLQAIHLRRYERFRVGWSDP